MCLLTPLESEKCVKFQQTLIASQLKKKKNLPFFNRSSLMEGNCQAAPTPKITPFLKGLEKLNIALAKYKATEGQNNSGWKGQKRKSKSPLVQFSAQSRANLKEITQSAANTLLQYGLNANSPVAL